jgi:uncharacterized protein YybS (DUF2232 family)
MDKNKLFWLNFWGLNKDLKSLLVILAVLVVVLLHMLGIITMVDGNTI